MSRNKEPRTAWLVQSGEPLPLSPGVRRMRSAMLAEELIGRGYDVIWWTSAFDHFTKTWITQKGRDLCPFDGLEIKLLWGRGYDNNVSVARFRDHREVARAFRSQAARRPPPDVVVASLPPLVV